MGKFYNEIPDFLITWIGKQEMFWVATAPLGADGHVNVSPKGLAGSFHIVDAHKVWYEDCTGSGVETISHLRENRRITILFSAFEGPPRIARLFGKGTVHEFGTPSYEALLSAKTRMPGSRAVIVIDVHKVGTSCGFAVPFYSFQRHRRQLMSFSDKLESNDSASDAASPNYPPPDGLKGYWSAQNTEGIDGLPGLLEAFKSPTRFEIGRVISKKDFVGMKVHRRSFELLLAFLAGLVVTTLYFQSHS